MTNTGKDWKGGAEMNIVEKVEIEGGGGGGRIGRNYKCIYVGKSIQLI